MQERLTTSVGMNVGIIRNRGLEENFVINDNVRVVINPFSTIKLMDRVKFTYNGVYCEGEISQIQDVIGQEFPRYVVRVFACSDYSVLPSATECIVQVSDITGMSPREYSP